MRLPLAVAIPFGQEHVLKWTEDHAVKLHQAAVQAAKKFSVEEKTDEVALILFYEHINDRMPHSEIFLDRESLPDALKNAENYFASEELYEEAAEAKNYRELLEYKQEK